MACGQLEFVGVKQDYLQMHKPQNLKQSERKEGREGERGNRHKQEKQFSHNFKRGKLPRQAAAAAAQAAAK